MPDIFFLLLCILFFPAPAAISVAFAPCHIYFVVPAPQGKRCVVSQTFYIIDGFLPDIFKESMISGVHAAGKHKILPNHKTILIAEIIDIIFINTTPPNPDHVHVCFCSGTYNALVFFIANSCEKVIIRDIICSFGKDSLSVDPEIKTCTRSIGFTNKLN
ncbi:hypothetical protein ES705_45527 [subsurface metagenome]